MAESLIGARLVRLRDGEGRIHVAVAGDHELQVLDTGDMLATLERGELPEPARQTVPIADPETLEPPEPWQLLVPIDAPETWAAGVTYERSRAARMHESQVMDVYALVYEAERPELFMKDAAGRRTVGPGDAIAARSDATWTVPEPESFDARFEIECRILDGEGRVLFADETSTGRMRRSIDELIAYLRRDNPVPAGTVLLTGTGLVPPDEMTLTPGYTVEIRIPRIGLLRNPVAAAANSQEG